MRKYIDFADYVKLVARFEMSPEEVKALAVLNTEFKESALKLYELFKCLTPQSEAAVPVSTETEPAKLENKQNITDVVLDIPEPTIEATPIISKEEEHTEENGWFQHPKIKEIKANINGDILRNDVIVNPSTTRGYLVVSVGDKTYVAARLVYECCSGKSIPRGRVIDYKNDNKKDLRMENLFIKARVGHTSVDTYTVVEIAKHISSNPNQTALEIAEALSDRRDIRTSPTLINSILNGNYSDITDKYFHKGPGGIVVVDKTETDETANEESPEAESMDRFDKLVDEFDLKYLDGKTMTESDFVILICKYMFKDGKIRPSKDIKEDIQREYGEDIVPTDKLIMAVKEKRIGKDTFNLAMQKYMK